MRTSRALSRFLWPAIIIAVLLAPSLYLLWAFPNMPHLGALGDDGTYMVSAKSLAEGSGYRILSLPGAPAQTKFPPLFPFALSIIWKAAPDFPANLPWFALFTWAMLPVYLFLSWRVGLQLGLSHPAALALCFLLAWQPMIMLLSITAMSELMFSCLLLGSLLLCGRSSARGDAPHIAAAAGLLGAAAYLTRTAALPLLLAGPLYFILRREYKRAAFFFAAMAPAVMGWSIWARLHVTRFDDPTRAFYTDYFRIYSLDMAWRDVPAILTSNLSTMMGSIGCAVLSIPADLWWPLRIVGLVAVFLLFVLLPRREWTPVHLFAACYCPLVLLLPYPTDLRMLVPVLPFALAGAVASVRFRYVMLAWFCLVSSLMLLGKAGPPVAVRKMHSLTEGAAPSLEAYRWISVNTPPDAAFFNSRESQVYFHCNRRSIMYQLPTGIIYRQDVAAVQRALDDLPRYARAQGIDYFLTVQGDPFLTFGEQVDAMALPVIEKNYDRVFSSGGAVVYRLKSVPPQDIPAQ
jgi:hypothetical protein